MEAESSVAVPFVAVSFDAVSFDAVSFDVGALKPKLLLLSVAPDGSALPCGVALSRIPDRDDPELEFAGVGARSGVLLFGKVPSMGLVGDADGRLDLKKASRFISEGDISIEREAPMNISVPMPDMKHPATTRNLPPRTAHSPSTPETPVKI